MMIDRNSVVVTAAILAGLATLSTKGGPDLSADETLPEASVSIAVEEGCIPFNPEGRWVLTLPAGWQRKVTISRASDDTYFFKGVPGLLLNGVYLLDQPNNLFELIEADDPTEVAYDWQVLNANTLQLVRQETPSGGNYLGATLSRNFQWRKLEDNSRVERVGTLSHQRGPHPLRDPRSE